MFGYVGFMIQVEDNLDFQLEMVGEPRPGEYQEITDYRDGLEVSLYFTQILKGKKYFKLLN